MAFPENKPHRFPYFPWETWSIHATVGAESKTDRRGHRIKYKHKHTNIIIHNGSYKFGFKGMDEWPCQEWSGAQRMTFLICHFLSAIKAIDCGVSLAQSLE